jgi:serine protease Do
MSNQSPKHLRSILLAGGAAAAMFGGFVAAPALFSSPSAAKEIVIAPPGGAPMSFADLIEKVSPAVVSITVKQRAGAAGAEDADPSDLPPGFEDFLRRLPQQQQPKARQATALGSGFFISDKGYIVTNHHVIENASDISIRTSAGKEYSATLVGSDSPTDLAVLKVDKPDQNFAYVSFDREADLRVGDWVVAVGNPFGLEGTATAGIVSARGRKDVGAGSSYVDFLQIDAPINRGNSGGPTFDLRGRVVGVNSAIFSPTGGSVGIGFAIPSETAATVVESLVSGGRVARGYLGVTVQGVDEDMAKSLGLQTAKGAMVLGVSANGPAAKAGIHQGDVILRIGDHDVEDYRDLTRRIAALPAGKDAQFLVLRDGKQSNVAVRLVERPDEDKLASADGGFSRGGGDEKSAAPNAGQVRQASLGVTVRPVTTAEREKLNLTADKGGVLIAKLDADSALAEKGVQEGDVILAATSKVIRTPADLAAAVDVATKAKRPILLLIAGRGWVAVELKAA